MYKISFIISSLAAGGAERVLTALANHLSNHRHDVTIITQSDPLKRSFYPLDKKIKVVYLNTLLKSPSTIFSRIGEYGKRLLKIRRTVKALNPQVVISFMDVMNINTLIASMGTKIPVIACERINPHFHKISWLQNIARKVFYLMASKIMVQTSSAKEFFTGPILKKVYIIPNGINPAFLKVQDYDAKDKVILNIGRLVDQKNQAFLIEAFAKVHPQFPDWHLHLYGEGPDQEKLYHLIRTLGVENHVILKGSTKDPEKILSQGQVFVFPSKYEGFPNALGESMAVGLPVIASDISGNHDLVEHGVNGLLFELGNKEMLIQQLKDLMVSPTRRQQLGTAAAHITHTYNPEVIFKQWEEIIKTSIAPS